MKGDEMNPEEIVEKIKETDDRIENLTKRLRQNKYFLVFLVVLLAVQLTLLILLSK